MIAIAKTLLVGLIAAAIATVAFGLFVWAVIQVMLTIKSVLTNMGFEAPTVITFGIVAFAYFFIRFCVITFSRLWKETSDD